ncbi:MAG: polysaccharide deacetylase family protein [Cyanothece sp. SIO2G6]|nr:polysaccharide deacetylase family protein [Cyanothece sp. SIO2G6]
MAISRWMISSGVLVGLTGLLAALALQPLWLLTGLSPLICPNAIYAIETDQPVLALTIDDGPDLNPSLAENTTTAMLTLLQRYQARATFFLISDKLMTPVGFSLAQAIVDQGHELGNHFTTDIRSIRPSITDFAQGVATAEQTLKQFDTPQWFRPAGGLCSASNAQILQSQSYDYDIVLGNIWPYDTHVTSVPLATRQILNNAQPGAILILHDSDKAGFDQPTNGNTTRGQRALHILEMVLPALRAKGFQVVSLSELATYGEPIRNTLALPRGLDTLRRRLISGMLFPSILALPSRSSWGAIALTALIPSVLMLWLGFHHRFLRWQRLAPPSSQSYPSVYTRIIATSFLLPSLVEESIFRLMLLPTPEEIMGTLTQAQWLECAISLGLFVLAHPLINGPLRDRSAQPPQHGTQNGTTYSQTFRQPVFLGLATILGGSCTLMYLQSGSIWPSTFFHWIVVATWLLVLGGHDKLHSPQ